MRIKGEGDGGVMCTLWRQTVGAVLKTIGALFKNLYIIVLCLIRQIRQMSVN